MLKISVNSRIIPFFRRLKLSTSKRLAIDIFKGVKKLTPVDTGRAKRGWRMLRRRFGMIVINNVPYINYLDQGSSKKAPRGMTKPTLEKLNTRNRVR